MRIVYECDICRSKSVSEAAIRSCEAQGKHSKYQVGQKVKFLFAPRSARWVVSGEIVEIVFGQITHHPSYVIHVGNDERLEERARNINHSGISEDEIIGTL